MFSKKTVKDVDVARQARARARRLQRADRRRRRHRRHARPCRAADDPLPRRPRREGHPVLAPRAARRASRTRSTRCDPVAPRSAAPARPQRRLRRRDRRRRGARRPSTRMVDGEILMLENVRFEPGEKANDPAFAKALASLADIYVNDAFGAAHRAHASTEGVAHFLPAYAGLLLAREVETLTDMLDRPGAPVRRDPRRQQGLGQVRRHRPAHRRASTCCIIGGGMAFTFLVAKGIERRQVDRRAGLGRARQGDARPRPQDKGVDLMLPVDFVVADAFAEDAETQHRRPRGDPRRHDGSRHRSGDDRAVQAARSPTPGPSSGTARWASSR